MLFIDANLKKAGVDSRFEIIWIWLADYLLFVSSPGSVCDCLSVHVLLLFPGFWFNIKMSYSIGNPIVEIRQCYYSLISTMGFPILVRWHLYIESGPWFFCGILAEENCRKGVTIGFRVHKLRPQGVNTFCMGLWCHVHVVMCLWLKLKVSTMSVIYQDKPYHLATITQLIWTIWTSLSAVLRKAIKCNLSLTHLASMR